MTNRTSDGEPGPAEFARLQAWIRDAREGLTHLRAQVAKQREASALYPFAIYPIDPQQLARDLIAESNTFKSFALRFRERTDWHALIEDLQSIAEDARELLD